MRVDLFDYDLPGKLIANSPANPRDSARLMVMAKNGGDPKDFHFFDLPNLLKEGDILVFNKSKVIPARLLFDLKGREIEVFLVKKVGGGIWKCLVRPGKLFREGAEVDFGEIKVRVVGVDSDGLREINFGLEERDFSDFLRRRGRLPVPPYIKGGNYRSEDYNTVFAEKEGSVAAPTAGLHFTKELLARLFGKGIALEYITLQVGLGTFLPMKSDHTEQHKMHSENYQIDFPTAQRLNAYKAEGRRIIAVGTTSVRVLEDNFGRFGKIIAGEFQTNIFIKPGYQWKIVDGLITNFHLPKSTLLMLVGAFAGRERILKCYETAIRKGYKFYSFGDGMLLI